MVIYYIQKNKIIPKKKKKKEEKGEKEREERRESLSGRHESEPVSGAKRAREESRFGSDGARRLPIVP